MTIATQAQAYIADLLNISTNQLKMYRDSSNDPEQPSVAFDLLNSQEESIYFHVTTAKNRIVGSKLDSMTNHNGENYTLDFFINGVKCRVAICRHFGENITVEVMQWTPKTEDEVARYKAARELCLLSPVAHVRESESRDPRSHGLMTIKPGYLYFCIWGRAGLNAAKRLEAKYGKPTQINGLEVQWDTPTATITWHGDEVNSYFTVQYK